MRKGITKVTQKHANRGLVFQLLATKTATSRIALAQESKLSKMALSNIVSEFLEANLIREPDNAGRGSRSNPIALSVSPDAPKVLGIMVQRHCCVAAVCSFAMEIIDTDQVNLPPIFDEAMLLQALYAMTDRVLLRHPDIMGIGIGSIGPVDTKKGIILNPPGFQGIRNLPLRSLFAQRYPLPVCLEHHYNCAALTEALYGNGVGFDNLVYVGLSTGIGMGVISGGQLVSDQNGFASELGHMSISFDGPICRCGNRGCLEVYANVDRVMALAADDNKLQGVSDFAALCRSSDHGAADAVLMDNMVAPLGHALCSVVNLLNPDLILLGDEAAALQERHFDFLRQQVDQRCLARNYHSVKIQRAAFDSQYNAAMCAISIMKQVFDGEHLF